MHSRAEPRQCGSSIKTSFYLLGATAKPGGGRPGGSLQLWDIAHIFQAADNRGKSCAEKWINSEFLGLLQEEISRSTESEE